MRVSRHFTAAALLALILTAAAGVLWWSPWSYAAQDRAQASTAISASHPLGTDELGRDRLVRSSAALWLDLLGSLGASAAAAALSLLWGLAAAFLAPGISKILLFLGDLFLALPWIFLLMAVRSALPLDLPPRRSVCLIFGLLAFLGAPVFLRFHYNRLRSLRHSGWLLQARAAGLRPAQTVRQFLPHLRPLLATQLLLYVPACIVAEANLGALGLGVGEPLASWGSMLQALENNALTSDSRLVYVPLALLVVVLALLEVAASGRGKEVL